MSEDTDEIATSPIKGDSTRSISLKRLLFGWGFGIAAVIFIVSTAIGVDSREQDIRQGVIDLGVRQASELAIVSERTLGIVDVILPEIMMQVVTTPSVEVTWIVDPQQKVAFATVPGAEGRRLAALTEEISRDLQNRLDRGGPILISELNRAGEVVVARTFTWPAAPGQLRSGQRGAVVLRLDPRVTLAAERNQILIASLVSAGLYLLAIAAALLALYGWLGSSINALTKVAERLGTGRYSERARPFRLEEFNIAGNAFNRMADEIESAIARAEREGRFNSALLELAPDPVMTIDDEGRLRFVNRAASRVFGYSTEELVGQPVDILLEGSRRERANQCATAIERLETLLPDGDTVEGVTRDGRIVQLEVSRSALDIAGDVVYTVIARDVTARLAEEQELQRYRAGLEGLVGERTKELESAMRAAESATQAKSKFLANMSHEVRTPMNAIIGMTHLLLNSELDSRQRNYLGKVHMSAQHLLGIINDILDFSKIEAGKLELEREAVIVDQLLDKVASLIGERCAQKGVELILRVDSEVPETIIGDPLRLSQALINLANNAVKFTEKGSILIEVGVERSADERRRESMTIRFSVKDTGIGIAAEDREKLFNAFSQIDASTTRRYGGTGLGLVIARQLAQLMGGTAGFDSELGRGSTFWFTARVGIGAARVISAQEIVLRDALSGRRAIVVDDNESARMVLGSLLQGFGLAVSTVESGAEALAEIQRTDSQGQSIDFAFIDWRMPDLDGIEVARRLEALSLKHPPQVVLVTAFGQDEMSSAARGVRFRATMTKPIVVASLVNLLQRLVGLSSDEPSASDTRHAGDTTAVGLRGVRVLVVEDDLLNQEVIGELLREVGCEVTIANNGQEGLNALLGGTTVDVVLMDMQMPVMDGLMATRELRKRTEFVGLPVIALTGNAMSEDRARCLAAGMNDHVPKPVDPAQLWQVMGRWVSRSAGVAVRVRSAQPAGAAVSLAHLDVLLGLTRSAGKADLYQRLLRKFTESNRYFGVRLREALNADIGVAHRMAHTLKGTAGTIGATALAERAARLDQALLASLTTDRPAVEALLADLEIELDGVIGDIDIFLKSVTDVADARPAETETKIPMSVPEETVSRPPIEEFEALLVEDDPSAAEWLERHEAAMRATYPDVFRALQSAIAQYDLGEALSVLRGATRERQSS